MNKPKKPKPATPSPPAATSNIVERNETTLRLDPGGLPYLPLLVRLLEWT